MTALRAVGWAHDRCMRPMRASADEWLRLTGVEISWEERPGHSFANDRLDRIAPNFDIISYDHPFVGSVAESNALLPLDELLPASELDELAADSIGPSHTSYAWADHQWGLATDAACQVSVVRPDLLPETDIPRSWSDALELAATLHRRVTTSLSSHDAICSLFTLCANAQRPLAPNRDQFADPTAALPALEWLLSYTSHCHPSAWNGHVVGPMLSSDDIVYGLFQWGYINHSWPSSAGPRLSFVDIPSTGDGPMGATLGGAGLGLSTSCVNPQAAAEYIAWVTGAEAQRNVVFPHRGQPASRAVWDDAALDNQAGGFFSGTRASMANASIRPRDAWWPTIAHPVGRALAEGLRAGESPERILAKLDREYHRALDAS
jgi:multiple sugar transport system substrate-binding protein